ncbi:formylglycine-generating enzyme family protein [Falsirhodobacter sp. 1013]|uniref:formylglycine-generating enzyme family protein n=1 Tax=Falsirhodobacter sp. 1013 TaxID=3417566 RepID=UPI003EC132F0
MIVTGAGSRDRLDDYHAARPAPGAPPRPGMVWVPGGTFLKGCDHFYPEERPQASCDVAGFWMDTTPVTNAGFRAFVKATGHVTTAEQPIFEGGRALPPHGMVFVSPKEPVPLEDPTRWWRIVDGATWQAPRGPASSRPDRWLFHPVVQVSLADAQAYARWAGADLPSEAEWEFAARAGLDGAVFAWGDVDDPAAANRWRGTFPRQSEKRGGRYTSPVDQHPPNRYGLRDMIGNVWEWTASPAKEPGSCCSAPTGGTAPRHVLKGGSHLCAPNYCFRYRPAARMFHDVTAPTSHIGFRCVIRA